jgi:transposase
MAAEHGGRVVLDEVERTTLRALAAQEPRVRVWRRYQALLLLDAGQPPATVATALGCGRASVYSWGAAWRQRGAAGVRPSPVRGGRHRTLTGAGEALLRARLTADPQALGYHATGWTVPLLLAELLAAGHTVGARTVRRTLHRLGWRWKRPKYVLGRPDLAYEEKKGA